MRNLIRTLVTVAIAIGYAIATALMPRWDNTKKAFVGGADLLSVDHGVPSVISANGNSGWLSSQDIRQLNLLLAISGTVTGTAPTLDMLVETSDSPTGATNVRTIAAFAQKTSAAAAGGQNERKTFTGFDDYYRVRWTVGGTTPVFNGVTLVGNAK